MATLSKFKVFYQFQFADKLKESGITFVHHAVDDATKNFTLTHYDHGNGIVVADVDGDGLYDIYFVDQVGGNELWKNLGGASLRTRAALVRRQLMPGLISSLPEMGGLPPFISFSTSYPELDDLRRCETGLRRVVPEGD